MNKSVVQNIRSWIVCQFRKPECLLVVTGVASSVLLVWLLFRPGGELGADIAAIPEQEVQTSQIASEDITSNGRVERSLDDLLPAVDENVIVADETEAPVAPSSEEFPQSPAIYIAIIIDDIGNNAELGERAINLPGAVTYAVLPHTPFGAELASQAHALGKEVMLHAPMSNIGRHPLGDGGLTSELSEVEFTTSLERSLDSIPHVQGVNNHMGSELTGAKTQMQWVMRELKERHLYFVDSMTTADSVAGATATEFAVPTLRRHVFLDNEATFENIDREFQRLVGIARERGYAVGIGHPYEQTLDYLQQALPKLQEAGVTLVPVSTMLQYAQGAHSTPDTTPDTTSDTTPDTTPQNIQP